MIAPCWYCAYVEQVNYWGQYEDVPVCEWSPDGAHHVEPVEVEQTLAEPETEQEKKNRAWAANDR